MSQDEKKKAEYRRKEKEGKHKQILQKKDKNLSNVVLNNNKKSGEKRRRNYVSILRKQNKRLKLKVKLFINKMEDLKGKLINQLRLWLKISLKIIRKKVVLFFVFYLFILFFFSINFNHTAT